MKTRTGFVSNSSSSSFIAVATEDAFKEALSRLENDKEIKLLKYIAKKGECLGQKVKIIKEFSDAGGCSSIWGYDQEDKAEILEKAGIEEEDEDSDWTWEAIPNYCSILTDMAKEKDWKDKVFQEDVGDGG